MENLRIIYIPNQSREPGMDNESLSRNFYAGEMGADWRNQRESTNIIDLREQKRGRRRVIVTGYLTWNTFFHLFNNTAANIANSLLRRAFDLTSVFTSYRDKRNSQYNFTIYLWVWNQHSLLAVSNSVRNALLDVAYANSIRISGAYNLDAF